MLMIAFRIDAGVLDLRSPHTQDVRVVVAAATDPAS
jgi:hypothetical protein